MGKSQARKLRQMSTDFKKRSPKQYFKLSQQCSSLANAVRAEIKAS